MAPVHAFFIAVQIVALSLVSSACGKLSVSKGSVAGAPSADSFALKDGAKVRPPVAVSADCTPRAAAPWAELSLVRDISYATLGGQTLRLDVASPRDQALHPLVVLVHGGDFRSGDKADAWPAMQLLASRGYAVAALNYRLNSRFPAQIQDLRCAVRWLRAHAAAYHLQAEHLAIAGDGSGATLASLMGTNPQVDAFDHPDCGVAPLSQPATVSAVIASGGQADLHLDANLNTHLGMLNAAHLLSVDPASESPAALERAITAASPITYAEGAVASYLLLHDRLDPRVLPVQDLLFSHALEAAGLPVAVVEGGGAGQTSLLFAPEPQYRDAYCSAFALLKSALSP